MQADPRKKWLFKKIKSTLSNSKLGNKKGIFTKKKIKNAKSKLYFFEKQKQSSQKKIDTFVL